MSDSDAPIRGHAPAGSHHEPVTFPPRGEAGTISGRLRTPAATDAPAGIAVLCHPHPDFGGTMDVWLLPAIAEALAAAGWLSLRFDFRSTAAGVRPGHHADVADVAGAVDFLRDHASGVQRQAIIGWSFGALVGLRYGLTDSAITDWVGIAPPTGTVPGMVMDAPPLEAAARWAARRTVIVGAHDAFFPPASVEALHADTVHVLADADHFLFDLDRDVARMVTEALA